MRSSTMKNKKAIFTECHNYMSSQIWMTAEIVILITGLVANTVLLWLLLRERKSLSASKVLGLNLVVMDLLYLILLPVTVYTEAQQIYGNNSKTIANDTVNLISPLERTSDAISILNLIGCPLLLACMCAERYLAVVWPVLYLRLRRWEYRMAVSAVVWALTLFCCVDTAAKSLNDVLLSISIIISCLFIIMLACLGGVVWSLRKPSPAHTTYNAHAPALAPLKRQALRNVLVVVVPAVLSYFPVLLLALLMELIQSGQHSLNSAWCDGFEFVVFFPNFGLFIGPVFYLAKARQMLCLRGGGRATAA